MISFLKEIFLPTRFKDYFLFSTTFIGIKITKDKTLAVKLTAVGRKRTIIQVISKPIELEDEKNKSNAISQSIVNTIHEMGIYQELVLTLSNQGIIFKELSVPFIDQQKIIEILPFEIEPLIPFSKESAHIEFIQTKIYKEEKKSDIFVAIVQQAFLDKSIEPFTNASIIPQRITVRAFLMWSMFINSNLLSPDEHLIIDFENDHCTILFFINRQLRIIRVIPYSIQSVINQITQNTKQSAQETLQALLQNIELLPDSAKTMYMQGIKKFKTDISFTIQSLVPQYKALTLTLIHREYDLRGLSSLLAEELNAKTLPLNTQSFIQQLNIDNGQKINHQFLIPMLAALPIAEIEHINFARGQETKTLRNLYIKQTVTTLIIGIIIVFFMIFSYRNSLQVLNHEIKESESEIIQALRAEFEIPAEEKNIDDVIDYASREAINKQKTWLAFSNQARASLLQYLLELTEHINKEALGFSLERITFDQNKIILKAEVRDYEALKILERELRQSKLFSYIEPQDNPRFTMTINLLPLGEQE